MKDCPYICPLSKGELHSGNSGLAGVGGERYSYLLNIDSHNQIPVFIDESNLSSGDRISRTMYEKDDSEFVYENFLSWLFETFSIEEAKFRSALVEKLELEQGDRVLVTGCGLGDDIRFIASKVGEMGEIFAQDISDVMIVATARRLAASDVRPFDLNSLYLSVSNASMLPYEDSYFDAAFHFGGINLFSDVKSALSEMTRVVKVGGKVLIGDEGVAPWLKEKEYGKAAICNNDLWAMEPPLSLLPENAANVHLTWVLGNCFYVIDFDVSDKIPFMNMNVPHRGKRGGSMLKRYYGKIDGIDPELKERVELEAMMAGLSINEWVESVVTKGLTKKA